jgi:hypothetical protein
MGKDNRCCPCCGAKTEEEKKEKCDQGHYCPMRGMKWEEALNIVEVFNEKQANFFRKGGK